MITRLQLKQFRNHKNLDLSFHHNLVAITGANAIGKTNILEALYISSLTKSFRGSDKTLIHHAHDFYTIDKIQDDIKVHIRMRNNLNTHTKQARINDKNVSLLSLIGNFPITLFEPNDTQLLTGLPGIRRDYINKILSQVDIYYLQNLREFQKLLKQRNNLLRQAKKNLIDNIDEQLFVYNIQLAKPAYYISKKRYEFLQAILDQVSHYYQSVSNDKKQITISFQPSVNNEDHFIKQQELRTKQDKSAGFTTYGPHREDFSTLLDDNILFEIASRGEIRTLVLAYKIAELTYIEKKLGKRPTLLLDDVLSELDDQRQRLLIDQIQKQQTFITTTHLPTNIESTYQHIELPL